MTGPADAGGGGRVAVLLADRLDRTVVERMLAQGGFDVEARPDAAAIPSECLALVVDPPGECTPTRTTAGGDDAGPAVIALCAASDASAVARALDLGVDAVLVKPLRVGDSLARVRDAIARRARRRAMAEQGAVLAASLRRAQDALAAAHRETLTHLALVSACRDDDTIDHQLSVARLARAIATALGHPDRFVEMLELAAPLHDIGKIAIPDAILFKPGPLTDEEMRQVHRHCAIGARLLSGSRAPHMRMAEEIAAGHHERWDGTGYPAGLRGPQIPPAARIVALADAYDTMLRDRPYRSALSEPAARAAIRAAASSHFDPDVVAAFEAANPPGGGPLSHTPR